MRGSGPPCISVCKGGFLATADMIIAASLKATKCTSTEGSWTAEMLMSRKERLSEAIERMLDIQRVRMPSFAQEEEIRRSNLWALN